MRNLGIVMAAGALATGTVATADMIDIAGNVDGSAEMTGATFFGTLDYTFGGGDMGTLVVSLTNDTPDDVGGFLTGFLFNIASADDSASATLSATTDPDFLNTGAQDGNPFGSFDAGAALGANWQGGGNPSDGLGLAMSGMFTFDVVASDADILTASSFLGFDGDEFVVRFRGLNDGGSDKVPVPAPATGALLLGALAMGARRRR